MPIVDKQIVGERSEALALVYLTRREDVRVERPSGYDQIDLLVSILEDGREIGCRFGVIVTGVVSEQDLHRWNADQPFAISRRAHGGQDDIPICVFVFVMLGDQGYWKWLQEPVLHGQQRELSYNTDPGLRRLDNTEPRKTDELTTIINAVSAWYDHRRTLVGV